MVLGGENTSTTAEYLKMFMLALIPKVRSLGIAEIRGEKVVQVEEPCFALAPQLACLLDEGDSLRQRA